MRLADIVEAAVVMLEEAGCWLGLNGSLVKVF